MVLNIGVRQMAKTEKTATSLPRADAGFSATNEFVGPKKVRCTFSVRRSAEEPAYVKTCVLDFSSMTDQELVTMALYGAKVRLQAALRGLSPEAMLNPSTMAEINVKTDLLERPRVQADPDARAVAALVKVGIPEAEARKMIEQGRAAKNRKAA
jgi:hypothetical protein